MNLEKNDLIGFMKKIRSQFGDKKLFLTFSPFKGEILKYLSTFGPDNIDQLELWLTLMKAKFFSGDIDALVVAARKFLPDKVDIEDVELLEGFDEIETYEAQITDAFTGDMLKHESGLVYRSSIELYDSLVTLKK